MRHATTMIADDVRPRLEPLLQAAPERERRWLRKLFASAAAYNTYSALDNELFVRDRYRPGPVLIASAARGEGRTTVALTLAALSCAHDPRRRILLVDADVDAGILATKLGIGTGHTGLRELFEGQAEAADCVHATALPNLWVTPVRATGPGAVRLAPDIFQSFVDSMTERFDLIVVDSPAGGANRSILALASIVRRVFLVVKYGGPTHEQIARLLDNLRRVDAEIIGAILNQREMVVPRLFYGAS